MCESLSSMYVFLIPLPSLGFTSPTQFVVLIASPNVDRHLHAKDCLVDWMSRQSTSFPHFPFVLIMFP